MHKAHFSQTMDDGRIACNLCPQACIIARDKSGLCGTRRNLDNKLYAINYGQISGLSMDPIEKKPLYHYYPGKQILSAGTLGCNLHCRFCQNYHISQYYRQNQELSLQEMTPRELVDEAIRQESLGIAYTYSEPVVWYEYIIDTGRIAHSMELKNVLVSNGFINPGPLRDLLPFIDAANIDLKAFSEEHYRALGGSLEVIKENIRRIYESGTHLELTTLVVTGFNDKRPELEELFSWIADLDKNIPLHLSRYFPSFRSTAPATDPRLMEEMTTLGRSYLHYIYPGNISGDQDSRCPSCGSTLVERKLYHTSIAALVRQGESCTCQNCQAPVPFIL